MSDLDDGVPPEQKLLFSGGRFEGRGVHLEGLIELVRYQRLVVEFAKDVWFEIHGEPMPSRIQKQFSLRLADRQQGSFDATILSEEMRLAPEVEMVAEMTQGRINETFDQIVRGLRPVAKLSEHSERALLAFGGSFKRDEALIIHPDTPQAQPFNAERRTWLKTVLKEKTVPVEGALIGQVFKLDTAAKRFQLTLPNGSNVVGRYKTEAQWESIRPFLDQPKSRTLIRLVCTYTAGGLTLDPLRIDDVKDIEVFTFGGDAWTDNLTELASLRTGWFGQHLGQRIDISALELTRDILRTIPLPTWLMPQAFPTVDGGVQIEWLDETSHTELTITPDLGIHGHHYDASTKSTTSAEPVGVAATLEFLKGVGRAQ
jgi:hypothetical protein